MQTSDFTKRSLRAALLMGAAVGFMAVPQGAAMAQPAPESLEEIIVTGSRIRTPGLESNSPIATVTAEEFRLTQPVAVEELLRNQPAVSPAIGPGTNNGSGGGATVDLRNLGTNRTLVLINGRRVTPFNLAGVVDTNVIPIALVERVDLVTGGASAVYGADAIAGVLNFILKDDFEGANVTGSYGISEQGDGNREKADFTIGGNFDNGRGNATISVGYTKTDPIRQDARDFGLTTLSSTTGAPVGSGTAVPGRFSTPTVTGGTPLGGTLQINTTTGRLVPTFSTFNFNPDNLYQAPLDREQITALANYEITDYAEVYTQLMFVNSDVFTQLAPSGTFLNVFQVPIGNPFIPEPARQQLCAARGIAAANCVAGNATEIPLTIGRRITEFGPRENAFENTMYQITMGLRGDITERWSYDAYYTYGLYEQVQTRVNWGSLSRVQQALRALNTTSCTSTANGCVPLNVFGAEGSITPEMVNFINLDAVLQQEVQQQIVSGTVAGDLGEGLKSPLSDLPIGVAGGFEYRRVSAGTASDGPSQIQGEVLGTGAPTPNREGSFELTEFFGEVIAPLVADQPFAHALNLEGGLRYTRFETNVSDTYYTWKLGGDYAPVPDARLRVMYQKASRAPNVNELFAPEVSGLSNLAVDPCAGTAVSQAQANTSGTLSNLCRLTGVPLNVIGTLPQPSAGQINVLSGGNENLGPEQADTLTIGLVVQPRFVENLTITFDYYDIEMEDVVSNPSSTDILEQCYDPAQNTGLTLNAACQLVLRSPITGTFNGVDAPGVRLLLSNLGRLETSGFDLGVTYELDTTDYGMDLGSLRWDFRGTKIETYTFQATPSSVVRDCVGFYSIACSTPLPEYKWNLRTTWSYNSLDVSMQWRHISGVDEEPGGTVFLPEFSSIDAYDYFDLTLGYNITDSVRTTLTVLNLFDKDPPVVGNDIGATTQNSGNTFPQTYDTVGRFFTVGLNVTF